MPTSRTDDGLTQKQSRFVHEYLIDLNGKQAAIRAGYSPRTAESQGSTLLRNPKVAEAVQRAMDDRAMRVQETADSVLERLKSEANARISDLYGDDGVLLHPQQWPDVWQMGLVAGVKTQELYEGAGEDRKKVGETIEVRFSDRIKRVELIGKHVKVGAFRDKVALDPTEGMKNMLRELVQGTAIRPKET